MLEGVQNSEGELSGETSTPDLNPKEKFITNLQ